VQDSRDLSGSPLVFNENWEIRGRKVIEMAQDGKSLAVYESDRTLDAPSHCRLPIG
jgi:hypothetical protein